MKEKTKVVKQSLEFIQLATHGILGKVELGNIKTWLEVFYDGAKSDGKLENIEKRLKEIEKAKKKEPTV